MVDAPLYSEWTNEPDLPAIDSPKFPTNLRQFLMINEDGFVWMVGEKEVSHRYDMADMDSMEGIIGIWTWMGNDFYRVQHGREFERINTEDENPFYYGRTPLIAKGIVVGYITHTDH